jgi:hypothetical protein
VLQDVTTQKTALLLYSLESIHRNKFFQNVLPKFGPCSRPILPCNETGSENTCMPHVKGKQHRIKICKSLIVVTQLLNSS